MARLNGHRQTKGTETDKPIPTATAPHLDSTFLRIKGFLFLTSCNPQKVTLDEYSTFQSERIKKWLNSKLICDTIFQEGHVYIAERSR
jgi:hypothetical protein